MSYPAETSSQYPYETASTSTWSAPAPPVVKRRPTRLWLILIVVALVFFGGGIGVGLAIGGSSANTGAGKTFIAAGTLDLTDPTGLLGVQEGGSCSGKGGYSDIIAGTQVVIFDAAGKTLVSGSLEGGTASGLGQCTFTFSIDGVPAGVGPYSVEVSHRGKIVFMQADANNIGVSLGG